MKFQHPVDKSKTLHYEHPLTNKNLVFIQGHFSNRKYIELPEEWRGLINPLSISVHLTQIGADQSLIVKRVEDLKVYIGTNGMPANCYYLIFAERMDLPRPETLDTDSET
jgi:hypothetical protein